MGYALGIDVGTTFSAAAIWRDERVEVVAFETHRLTVPTVLYAEGDEVLFGTSAVTRGNSNPAGVAREFKRRLGDSVPLVLSGAPYAADHLVAMFSRRIVETVTDQLGGPPERVVVTHPANWTRFQLNLLSQALQHVGLSDVEFVSEPEAPRVTSQLQPTSPTASSFSSTTSVVGRSTSRCCVETATPSPMWGKRPA